MSVWKSLESGTVIELIVKVCETNVLERMHCSVGLVWFG